MLRYYWLVVRGWAWALVVTVEAAARAVRQAVTGRRERFAELAVRLGAARPDLAPVMFGPFGDREPGAAIEAATEARREAAADGFTTANAALFRHRLQALNTLYAAVDLGLLDSSALLGLVRPDAEA